MQQLDDKTYKICPGCKKLTKWEAVICPYCSVQAEELKVEYKYPEGQHYNYNPSMKNRGLAIFLAIFFFTGPGCILMVRTLQNSG